MKALSFLFLLYWSVTGFSQQKSFRSSDTRLKVFYGDTVAILTDSAYIVSAAQALLLNEKLIALRDAQQRNRELYIAHEELQDRVRQIEFQVSRLLERIQSDHRVMSENLQLIITDLDRSIAILQQTNATLSLNNDQLRNQLNQMDQTIQHLRQENRRMALRRIWDKVILGFVAFGVGYLVGSV